MNEWYVMWDSHQHITEDDPPVKPPNKPPADFNGISKNFSANIKATIKNPIIDESPFPGSLR
jgi:hypothetical protein